MKRFWYFFVTAAVCACIAVAVVFLRGVTEVADSRGVMRCLSDGFFTAGILSLVCGSFAFAGNQGLLDAFLFTFRKIWVALHRKEYRESHKKSYAEYREKKHVNQKPLAHFFAVGGAFAALGVLFTVLFYCL